MRNQKGFTLIELVVVMVIVAALAAFAIPKFFAMASATADKAYAAALDELNAREKQAWSLAKLNVVPGVTFSDEDHVWNPHICPAGNIDLGSGYTWSGTILRNNGTGLQFQDATAATFTRAVSTGDSPGRWTYTYTP